MMYPLISILVANYNNGCFIAETLDSICAQTYPNIEVVIVDDCSTDKSLQVISAYLSSHLMHSISVFQNEVNSGCGYTKRRLIDLSKGEYFIFVDPDDVIESDTIETLYKGFVSDNYSIVYATQYLCNSQLKILSKATWPAAIPEGESHFTSQIGHVSAPALCKRSCYDRTVGINPSLIVAEDQDLYIKMEEVAPVRFIDICLYYYRGHDHNMSRDNAHLLLNARCNMLLAEDTYQRRRRLPNLPNISYKDLQHKRLEYYLLKYKSLMKEKKYAKAFCSIVCAFPYSFFDKKLRLYKVVIKSILIELKKMILK